LIPELYPGILVAELTLLPAEWSRTWLHTGGTGVLLIVLMIYSIKMFKLNE
jgi:hypothetical protein